MQHTLTLTGSSAALAAAMTAFDAVEAGNPPETPTVSTDTGAGTPDAPASPPSEPSGDAPTTLAPSPSTSQPETSSQPEADATGLPWDERIHASPPTTNKDGTWRAKRGVKDDPTVDVEAIEAELRGTAGNAPAENTATIPPAAPPSAPAPSAPVAPSAPPPPMPSTQEPVEAMDTAGAATPLPLLPASPAAPTADATTAETTDTADSQDGEWDFFTLMNEAAPKFGEGDNQLSKQYLTDTMPKFGLSSLTDLATKPEAIPQVVAQFKADGRW